jgi:hypothetical protein
MSDMAHLLVPAAAWIAMIVLSAIVAFRLPANARLPMQWGPAGKPTWTAPTWFAIAFTPILALIVYTATIFAGTIAGASVGEILSLQGLLFLLFHAAHLYFATR